MDDMHQYWLVEFKNAWVMLNEKMYLPDGYDYGREKGMKQFDEDGNVIDPLTEMISLKAQIEWDTRHGVIFKKFRFYTIRIWGLLGMEEY